MDYAYAHLLGRAVNNATIFKDDGKPTKAVFDLATNLSIRKNGELATKSVFHRVIVWGYHADYLDRCQNSDPAGLKGRLVTIVGNIDADIYTDPETQNRICKNVIRVGGNCAHITIMDRRTTENQAHD